MASNPVAAKRTRRRPKPGLRSSLRRHFRSEPTCHPKTCNQNFWRGQNRAQQDDCRNQQYSIIALTNSAAGIVERYAYSAYGEAVFATGAGVVLTESAKDNRYTYTGREWDEELGVYHFRARMYDSESGRFCSRDPIGYVGGYNLLQFVKGCPLAALDPSGLLAPPVAGAIIGCGFGSIWAATGAALNGGGLCECACTGAMGCILGGLTGAITALPGVNVTPMGQCAIGAMLGAIRGGAVGPLCRTVCGDQTRHISCIVANLIVQAALGCVSRGLGPGSEVARRNVAEILTRVLGVQIQEQCQAFMDGMHPEPPLVEPREPYEPVYPTSLPKAEDELCEQNCRYRAMQILGRHGPEAAEEFFNDCMLVQCSLGFSLETH